MAEYKLNYPVETPEALAFWESRHKLNRIKAIIAFSLDLDNANDNLRRRGWANGYRKKVLNIYKSIVNHPKMQGIPFSGADDYWWNPKPLAVAKDELQGIGIIKNSALDYTINIAGADVNKWFNVKSSFTTPIKNVIARRPATIDAQKISDTEFKVLPKTYSSQDQILIQLDDNRLISLHVISEAQPAVVPPVTTPPVTTPQADIDLTGIGLSKRTDTYYNLTIDTINLNTPIVIKGNNIKDISSPNSADYKADFISDTEVHITGLNQFATSAQIRLHRTSGTLVTIHTEVL